MIHESQFPNSFILAQVEEQEVSEDDRLDSSQTELEFIQILTP
jgi:hypothetical protein